MYSVYAYGPDGRRQGPYPRQDVGRRQEPVLARSGGHWDQRRAWLLHAEEVSGDPDREDQSAGHGDVPGSRRAGDEEALRPTELGGTR